MSTAQLKWVAAILLVAVAIWLLSEGTSSQPDDRETGRVLPEEVAGVDRVVVESGSGTIVLTRVGSDWTVNDLDISRTHLATFLAGLSDTAESELVARSSGVHARMGVDQSGTHFTFFRGNQRVDNVIFGKRGSDPATVFARRDGADAVYRYAGPIAGLVDLTVDDWRNHVVVNAPPGSVGRVTVEHGASRYDLEQRPGGWVLAPDTPADSSAVSRLLRSLSPLEARGFATEAQLDSVDFRRPERRLTLLSPAGDTIVALAFDSTDGRFWARSNQGPTVFEFSRWTIDQATPLQDMFVVDQ